MIDDSGAILLCDDDSGSVSSLAHVIRMHNLTVDVARSGVEAVEKIERRPFGVLVVVDSVVYNGLPLISFLQRTRPELLCRAVVVSTGASGLRGRALPAEVFATISKPIDAHELVALIKECSRREPVQSRVDAIRPARASLDDSGIRAQ